MLRYVIRRVLQMIPTIFGIIVITFILFNVVGGSPAIMTLGKNVSPKAIEEFDEPRGFNKPLLFGLWTTTHAYPDTDFARNAGSWRANTNVLFVSASDRNRGHIALPPRRDYSLPLKFTLRPDTGYQWILSYRLKHGSACFAFNRTGTESNKTERTILPIPPAASWKTIRIPFRSGSDPAALRMSYGTGEGTMEIRSLKLRRKMNSYFDSQFVFYLGQIARLDFGTSTYTNQRISRMLKDGILPSLSLAIPIFIIGLSLSISISLICAFFRNTWLDRSIMMLAIILMSVNYLVWIIFGQYFLGYKAGWFPIWGFESWFYLLLPVSIGIFSGLGHEVRLYRTVMLDEMYQDYVRTAFAKGVSRSGVLFRHVLKNAMIPILTTVVITIPFLFMGNLLLETFFGIPGLGNMLFNAINCSDVDVVRAIVFIGAIIYVFANLLTDLCYALVDPRIKLQ